MKSETWPVPRIPTTSACWRRCAGNWIIGSTRRTIKAAFPSGPKSLSTGRQKCSSCTASIWNSHVRDLRPAKPMIPGPKPQHGRIYYVWRNKWVVRD